MKIIFNEEQKLPLTYKYIEPHGAVKLKSLKPTTDVIKIEKIQSDMHTPSLPFKKLVRML
ncbi:hypothetical protein B0I18_102548 [Taibaiella chishuiensis]|uniref:Uncharacterized protein n=1 Tax=Taibaiella chishuiensis TaxID=1434707 RepID=A0A2P8D8L1_9BACT|nr:hypothetical protein B0I18_102548 [Taibaiella chishuiensis]